ncbi:MAG: hypothetical protein WAN48_03125 [Actinomycetes bacterium]
MAVVGTLVMSCPPGSPGCGQPPPPDGYVAFLTNILIIEAAVLIVFASAATLWRRHQRTVVGSSPWPEGGYWASYRRRFQWTALAVAVVVAIVLLAETVLAGSSPVHGVGITLMIYADALLVLGLPLSLIIAALPAHGHGATRSITP